MIIIVTIEQIDEFRKRTNSSYEDAKYYLEKNDGDILDAIIEFERTKTSGKKNYYEKKPKEDFSSNILDTLQKTFDTKVVVEDNGSPLFSFPIIILILLIPFMAPALIVFVLFIMLGYKVSIKEDSSGNVDVKSIFRNIKDKSKDAAEKQSDKKQKATSKENKGEESNMEPAHKMDLVLVEEKPLTPEIDDEDVNEYTIE